MILFEKITENKAIKLQKTRISRSPPPAIGAFCGASFLITSTKHSLCFWCVEGMVCEHAGIRTEMVENDIWNLISLGQQCILKCIYL